MIDLSSILEAIRRFRPDMLQRLQQGLGGGFSAGMGGGPGQGPPQMGAPPFTAQPFEPYPTEDVPHLQSRPMPLPERPPSPTLGRGRQPLGGGGTPPPRPTPPGRGPSAPMSPAPGGQPPWQSAGFDSRRGAVQAARRAGWEGDPINNLHQGLQFLREGGGGGGGGGPVISRKPGTPPRRRTPRGRS